MSKSNSDSQKIEEWRHINWTKAERYVYKQQKRIYAASRRGNKLKVRKLQRTLIRSWYNRALAVRRVTQDNRGKKTAGVDGVSSLSPKARLKLVGQLRITGKSKPTRRVWIPKPGKEEKRPLGIPTMYDRALQAVIKTALEPEWEAYFEANSFGFRPGRSCQDAIWSIKNAIQTKAKYVLDADLEKCFDRINHEKLLEKINHKGKVRKQIKSWLKCGVIDQEGFTATSEGTPQGGVLSPLLANIALHGLEKVLNEFIVTLPPQMFGCKTIGKRDKLTSLTYVRYADDFVIIHSNKQVILGCQEIISQWLKDIGLKLKSEKTRLTHTLNPEYSEDGISGFKFLGFQIRQHSAGKYKSAKNGRKKILGFNTYITPTKEALKEHQKKIGKIIKDSKIATQAQLISRLNPIIRGWSAYYKNSDIKTVGESSRQDYLVFLKLQRWARRRSKGNSLKAINKYWHRTKDKRVFASEVDNANLYELISHSSFECSSTSYVRVKGDKSPYDGDLIYWSIRMGRNPEMPMREAMLLKKQKGKCSWCGLTFREDSVLETDHNLALVLGGKDEWTNLQLLHGHCHDEKTALDLKYLKEKQLEQYWIRVSKDLNKYDWYWQDDILLLGTKRKVKSVQDN